ncbi:MAG TPA: hypothetical protein VIV11_41200 [Kofleriaceae bacterium]
MAVSSAMALPSGAWSLQYADGSANAYSINGDGDAATFEYDPVTPERSSTGMYSGGDPRKGPLDAARVVELWTQVRALEANAGLHTTERAKGTGAFSIMEAGATRSFIIERGPELLAFDALLAAL